MNANLTPLTWLDQVYGALFQPQATFMQLRSQPVPVGAALVVALANLLESLRLGQDLPILLINLVAGLVGWFLLITILDRLVLIFSKSPEVNIPKLLTLTGFASTPWIFMACVQTLENPWRLPLALVVGTWFGIWQIWATAIALAVSPWRLLTIIPLTLVGGLVGLVLLGNFFKLIFSV
ncbi:MAG: hypothetical protein SFT94_03055 [Pseudanabaenaceae cyanobacterium bins.68]|nr:hypothetical protein [Pseudanabaenaceae cyanobacterium bins.68]